MNKITDKILNEATLPNKNFSFEDMNGNNVEAMIGLPNGGNKSGTVIVGYQINGTSKHSDNTNEPDPKNLFYIIGRITKFVINYIKQYEPMCVIIQSDYEKDNIAAKRINIYKGLVDKNINSMNYISSTGKNQHGYYIMLKKKPE